MICSVISSKRNVSDGGGLNEFSQFIIIREEN